MKNNYELLDDKIKGYFYIIKINDDSYGSTNYTIKFINKKLDKNKNIIAKNHINDMNKAIFLSKLFFFNNEIINNEMRVNSYQEIISNIMFYLKKNLDKINIDIYTDDTNKINLIYKNFYSYMLSLIIKKYKYNYNLHRFKRYIDDLSKINNYKLKSYVLIKLYEILIIKNNLDKNKIPIYSKFCKKIIKNDELNSMRIENIKKIFNKKNIILHFECV